MACWLHFRLTVQIEPAVKTQSSVTTGITASHSLSHCVQWETWAHAKRQRGSEHTWQGGTLNTALYSQSFQLTETTLSLNIIQNKIKQGSLKLNLWFWAFVLICFTCWFAHVLRRLVSLKKKKHKLWQFKKTMRDNLCRNSYIVKNRWSW